MTTTPNGGGFDSGRLAVVDALTLAPGQHPGPDAGACVMEAVAYLAGEPWSDAPACASPVISAFLRAWNDVVDHRRRQDLKAYVARLAGSRGTPAQEAERVDIVAAWFEQVDDALPAGRRGRAPVEAAVYTALRALDPDANTDVWMPPGGYGGRTPWITRPVIAAAHRLLDELLAITETPAPPAPAPLPVDIDERAQVDDTTTRRARRPATTRRRRPARRELATPPPLHLAQPTTTGHEGTPQA